MPTDSCYQKEIGGAAKISAISELPNAKVMLQELFSSHRLIQPMKI